MVFRQQWLKNRREFDLSKRPCEMINAYDNDYKLIIVDDDTMSPYEIVLPDGANEH